MVTIKISPDFSPHSYERQAWQQEQCIFGVDEVGRGCLAGPVVTTCLMLEPNAQHELLQDSKLLTVKERLIAYDWLQSHSSYAVGLLNHRNIDSINIYQATLTSMKRSILQLLAQTQKNPMHILIDAMPVKLDLEPLSVLYCTQGEHMSASIAAASIIAKITRDALMGRLDSHIPGFGFTNHKGYATKKHKQALSSYGSSILHRKSFLKFLD